MTDSFLTFEHVIKVNNTQVTKLTLTQLWDGLLRKFLEPGLFTSSIENFQIVELKPHQYHRTIQFPNMKFEDFVQVFPMKEIQMSSKANGPLRFSSKVSISGEEETLSVHFCYKKLLLNDEDKGMTDYFKQVYKQTDYDAIALIRRLY